MLDATGRELLNAVVDPKNWDDDTHRLVFADWLEEQPYGTRDCPNCNGRGEVNVVVLPPEREWRQGLMEELKAPSAVVAVALAKSRKLKKMECPECEGAKTIPDKTLRYRAEFIRTQIAMARWTPESPELMLDLQARERELYELEAAHLWGMEECKLAVNGCKFVRGFVESVNVDLMQWAYYGYQAMKLQPIRSVFLTSPTDITVTQPTSHRVMVFVSETTLDPEGRLTDPVVIHPEFPGVKFHVDIRLLVRYIYGLSSTWMDMLLNRGPSEPPLPRPAFEPYAPDNLDDSSRWEENPAPGRYDD